MSGPTHGLNRLPSYESIPRTIDDSMEVEPPIYSTQPNSNEETVAFTPRRSGPQGPEGSFVKKWSQATLILTHQEDDARQPTYGRNSIIEGELGLTNSESVISVSVKLLGHLNFTAADSGTLDFCLCSVPKLLWKQDDSDAQSQPQRCPSILPLSIPIPTTYTWDGKEYRMPPSFEATFLAAPAAMVVRVQYTLHVSITRTRSWKQSWFANKKYVTLVNYRPRSRPARPTVMLETVVSSIKPHPEDWTQIITKMNVRPKFEDAKLIECQVFIPSVQTYAITEPIPFHIQLTGTLSSLRELLPANSPQLLPHDQQPAQRRAAFSSQRINPIRVSISRQVVIEMNDRRKFKTFTVGHGKMWPVPPFPPLIAQGSSRVDYTAEASGSSKGTGTCNVLAGSQSVASLSISPRDIYAGPHDDGYPDMEYCLDWQGELKCWDEVHTGGFAVSHLCVKVSSPLVF